ncbi:hypothetical protein [Nocardiopsis synnemataformans]|uniref:hypothetical protein n=1 Tax=Nocardiopsis synnemataformans TaxID=61305 RepID=UPI003EBAF3AF
MIRSNRLNTLVRDAAEHGALFGDGVGIGSGTVDEEAAAAVRSYLAAATGVDAGQPGDPAAAYYVAAPAAAELPAGLDLSGLPPAEAAVALARAVADGARRAQQDAEAVERAARAMVAEHSS